MGTMKQTVARANIFLCLLFTALGTTWSISQQPAIVENPLTKIDGSLLAKAEEGQSKRTVSSFKEDWLFFRYGLQPDGSRMEEPVSPTLSPKDREFDDRNWRQLYLPHDWGIEGPFKEDLDGYTGKLPWRAIGWYRKHFTINREDEDNLFFIDFDGIMAHSEVFLNGVKIGGWPYGYTSFRVELTPYLRYDSENVLAVRVNTEELGSRWYPGAGIYRSVRLVRTDKLHVPQWGIVVTTPNISEQRAIASIKVRITNDYERTVYSNYRVEIFQLDTASCPQEKVAEVWKRDITIPAQATDSSEVSLTVKAPQLWELENRHLYAAKISVYRNNELTDVKQVTFGFRTIEFTHNNGFLLNGKRVQLKGVCMHHDLGALGTAVNVSAIERQLRILKSFGTNAIRTSHNPPAPELLDCADRMGFLIVDEIFDCWAMGKNENDYSTLYKQWHHKDIEALVCRDRNHPCVIMWSLGNETQEQYHPEMRTVAHLREIVRTYDITRPVSFGASYPSKSALNGTELQVDVHGMNYPSGIYGGPDFYGKFLTYPGHEHLSGYASESSSTMSSRGVYFPQGWQVTSYDLKEPGWGALADTEFAALEKYPAICGEFVWTGFDYLGEPTPFNSDKSVLLNFDAKNNEEFTKEKNKLEQMEKERPTSRSSYFGIVDLAGFPKDRYYLYKAHWMPQEPMVHILPHWNFPDREGQCTPVFVYSSGDEVELFLNGKSLGRQKKKPYEYRFKWNDVVYTPGKLEAVAYKNGKQWAMDCVHTTGIPTHLRLSVEKDTLCSTNDELAFITVSVCDKDGNVVPTASNSIVCHLEGEGSIVATDNGDPTSLVPFSSKERNAFGGLMLIVVKPHKNIRGILRITVSADNLTDASIVIVATPS